MEPTIEHRSDVLDLGLEITSHPTRMSRSEALRRHNIRPAGRRAAPLPRLIKPRHPVVAFLLRLASRIRRHRPTRQR